MAIGRIRAGRIQVSTRPTRGVTELLALVDGLEQLIDAGHDTIDVVLEGRNVRATELAPPTPGAGPDEADQRALPSDRPRTDAQMITAGRNAL